MTECFFFWVDYHFNASHHVNVEPNSTFCTYGTILIKKKDAKLVVQNLAGGFRTVYFLIKTRDLRAKVPFLKVLIVTTLFSLASNENPQ